MTTVPADTPDTVPLASTVATEISPLDHAPPVVLLAKEVVSPTQTCENPVIAAGKGLTASVDIPAQPVGNVYVIVTTPAETPVAIPVPPAIVATDVLLLVQAPPALALLKNVDEPTQTLAAPAIVAGSEFTVNVIVDTQPVPSM